MRCARFASALSVIALAGCAAYLFPEPPSPPPELSYRAEDINASGQIVGVGVQEVNVVEMGISFDLTWSLRWTAQEGWRELAPLESEIQSLVKGINEAGDVVGRSKLNPSEELHAFLLTNAGEMTDLGTLGGETSQANAVSDAGHVVGSSLVDTLTTHAFLWTADSGMIDLGTLGGNMSVATDVNNHCQVVGYGKTAAGETHAFIWTAESGMVDLGTLGGASSNANGINDQGQVVGFAQVAGQTLHPVIWEADGSITDLSTQFGIMISGLASDINENGDVVGSRLTIEEGEYKLKVGDTVSTNERAFLWTATGGLVDLGTLGGATSNAWAINDLGQVVGFSETVTGESHAFLWTADAGMTDLGTWAGAGN